MITPQQLSANGSEDSNQKALFCWANLNLIKYPQLKWLHHIPNGGSRHIIEAGKLKAMGVKRGVADIFLPVRQVGSSGSIFKCGLYIELKKVGGKLSTEQLNFATDVMRNGYVWKLCYGWEDARDRIIEYLEGK